MMSFIQDDGKGFVGVHAALDTNYKWPEYGEMIGGWFDQHPWMTFTRRSLWKTRISRRSGTFRMPFREARRDLSAEGMVARQGERAAEPGCEQAGLSKQSAHHRTDHDFAVAWAKMYGKGTGLLFDVGAHEEAWDDPDIQKMYFEAIKWVLGYTEGSTASHAKP